MGTYDDYLASIGRIADVLGDLRLAWENAERLTNERDEARAEVESMRSQVCAEKDATCQDGQYATVKRLVAAEHEVRRLRGQNLRHRESLEVQGTAIRALRAERDALLADVTKACQQRDRLRTGVFTLTEMLRRERSRRKKAQRRLAEAEEAKAP